MNRQTRKDLQARCQALYQHLYGELGAIGQEAERRDSAFALLSRLLFTYFLQHQGLLDGDPRYLQRRFEQCCDEGVPFSLFLATLTFEGFGTPAAERSLFTQRLLGRIPYLSGSLFPPYPAEQRAGGPGGWPVPALPDRFFLEVFDALDPFAWTLEEGGGGEGIATPALLATVVEHHVEGRKTTGSFYTPEFICASIVEETCRRAILKRFEEITGRRCDSLDHLTGTLDMRECALLLFVILPTISVLDPACGAADFLVVALRHLADIYAQVIERAARLHQPGLDGWVQGLDAAPGGRSFALKKRVACRNLFGIDILQAPLDTSKQRLALNLLSGIRAAGDQAPLPNLDYALPRGNALIGIACITEQERSLLARAHPEYDDLVATKNALVTRYQEAIGNPLVLAGMRAAIDACRRAAYDCLNEVHAAQLSASGAKIEETVGGGQEGHGRKKMRDYTRDDIAALDPLHAAYDFNQVMNGSGWERLDEHEAQVAEVGGSLQISFGPGLLERPSA